MVNLLPVNIVEIPLEDTEIKYLASLPLEKGKKYDVKIIPGFDFLIVEINGDIKKLVLGDSNRLEQELCNGKTIEMDVVFGSGGPVKAKVVWRGKRLAGGSKARTMEIVEETKIELKKAMPTSEVTTNIQAVISKINSNILQFIAIQDIEIYKGSIRIQKTSNWYE